MLRNRIWWCFIIVCILATPGFAQTGSVADLDPESTVKIGKIYVTGNDKTRLEIVLRELDYSEGDELKLADFAEETALGQQKLTNTRLFTLVEIVPLFMSDTEVD
ncbi:MAG: outer membrane protein assembly factor BamA, partial [Nonlabens sp.]